jgi:hypothetical protein
MQQTTHKKQKLSWKTSTIAVSTAAAVRISQFRLLDAAYLEIEQDCDNFAASTAFNCRGIVCDGGKCLGPF